MVPRCEHNAEINGDIIIMGIIDLAHISEN